MDVYVGQTRSRKLIARLNELGFGECTNRGEYPPRRPHRWFLDNGAFSDWKHARDFDGAAFWFDLLCALAGGCPPDFVVCPDRVATGLDSLAFSRLWLERCGSRLRALRSVVALGDPRWYLAVQDGMTADDVRREFALGGYSGIFVGGTLEWKIRTGAEWVKVAHELGVKCHVGRVGTAKRVRWAQRIGADSIDSCLPLWSEENLTVFLQALGATQTELPW